MVWQMWVVIAQLAAGGALVTVGFRMAAHQWLAMRDAGHAERLARATGARATPGRMAAWVAAMVVGALLLATINLTIDLLPPRQ